MIYSEEIPAALAGERLDRVVALVTGWSRSAVRPLLSDSRVTVNSLVPTDRVTRVKVGDLVVIDLPDVAPEGPPVASPEVPVSVVYEDEHVIVVEKMAGQVVHPGAGHADDTLVNALLSKYPEIAAIGQVARPGIVHRLDRDTSGLLVVARTDQAYDHLVSELAQRRVTRTYEAISLGHNDSPTGVVDAPIGRSRRSRIRMTVTNNGKQARTFYEVRNTYHEPISATWFRCQLESGRTHQIRVHLAAIGNPVMGDPLYGRPDNLGVKRTQLHAANLSFAHPAVDRSMNFASQLPSDMIETLRNLGEPDPQRVELGSGQDLSA